MYRTLVIQHTCTMVSSKNGTANNGPNGKVDKNGTFSILRFKLVVVGLEWGFRLGDWGLSLGLGKI